jgi:hypothetical protein
MPSEKVLGVLVGLCGAVIVTASEGPIFHNEDHLAVLKGPVEAVAVSAPGTFTVDLAVFHIAFINAPHLERHIAMMNAPLLERNNSFAVWDAADSFSRVLAFTTVDVL